MPSNKRKSDIAHESGVLHVTGAAKYVDDVAVDNQLLHGRVVYTHISHGYIRKLDVSQARSLEGVSCVLTHSDLPGVNNMGPVVKDEPVLSDGKLTFIGQAICLIAAKDEATARAAEQLIDLEIEELPGIYTIEQAMEAERLLHPPRTIQRGNALDAIQKAPLQLSGSLKTGAQEHWYLETQTCLCIPGEGNDLKVLSSTQHPSETQGLVAEALGLQKNDIEVEVRRMGGAFGGKETQANHTAVWCALLSQASGKPVKIRLFRDDDQIITGKRHPYLIEYEVGFNIKGKITGLALKLHANAGSSTDLSMAVLERAMMHAENSYYVPNILIEGRAWKTNLPSNTAFRGFGGPQGMAGIENILDRIARFLDIDSLDIRKRNLYGTDTSNIAPYGQKIENNRLPTLLEQLEKSSEYYQRRKTIDRFNKSHEFIKKGLALTPVKFGISFTTSFLNQAGALVHIYKDGTILANHGGTEMGQGLHTKIQQIVNMEIGVPLEKIKVNATNTTKVPNTSATAASAGTDLNGMAVKDALDKLKNRIAQVVVKSFARDKSGPNLKPEDLVFKDNKIYHQDITELEMDFVQAVNKAYLERTSLSATGFYRTPDIHFDREKGTGHPYHYYAFGMAVTEITLDTLTGHFINERVDILHDVGDSINQRLDIGQIEGGYIQGVGWCTTEECKYDGKGNLLNHSPDTYKIPNVQDIPKDFRTRLLEKVPNANTIRNSKAVAEPPFMLAFSCWLAIKDAISAVADHNFEPDFSLPATNEVILKSIDGLRKNMKPAASIKK
jgi:xanthine dehydrogenase molybdopterin binding subunit